MTGADDASWPAWATEPIAIAEPDPGWTVLAAALIAGLRQRLQPWLCDGIHHVGSTAVPELPAKPIIDLIAGIDTLESTGAIAPLLADDGWHLVPPELDGRPWQRLFVRVRDDRRTAHLHLMTAGSARWQDQLAFRDRLRADGALRREYAALKRRLAERHPDDREAYTGGKAAFVARVLGRG